MLFSQEKKKLYRQAEVSGSFGHSITDGLLKDLFKELLRKRFAGDPIAAILNSSIMPLELGAMCMSLLVFEYSDYTVEQLYNLLLHELQDVLKKHGINIQNLETYFTENEKYYIKLGLKELVQALTDIAATRTGTNNLFSLAMNGSKLGMAHYPELCLAWLQSQDPNYNGNNEQIYVPSKERLIRINCPVDISVFDSQGVLVAEIIDNCPQAVDGSSIPCAYTENGEKTITLPMDEAYHLVTKASDDGIMDISINLFDLNGNCVYIENYYDITLIKDHSVTIDLPRSFFVDENGIEYENIVCSTVINGSDNITASVVLDEEQTEAAEYSIIVDNRNTNGGVILGGGDYLLGSYALVTAAEYEDCSFVG